MLPIAKVMQKFEITKRSEDIFYYLKVRARIKGVTGVTPVTAFSAPLNTAY